MDGGGKPSPFWASRYLLQPPETTATAGGCLAISGATSVLSVLRAPGWILMSLLNLAQSSKPAGDADDRRLPGHYRGHPNDLCFECPRLVQLSLCPY